MYYPGATYRIQFNKDFTLADLGAITDYLERLGIKTIYASPILSAVPDSNHGYDVTDAATINPEIGDEQQLEQIVNVLKQKNVGWLQDIVPNHMAYNTANGWLMDVLENGPSSKYAAYFDIDLEANDKLMLPVLSKPLQEAIEAGDITITNEGGKTTLVMNGTHYPVNAGTLTANIDVAEINSNKEQLATIVNKQYYRPCTWQETDKNINYRRFFTINGMICLNIQDEHVFADYHKYVADMVKKGWIQGLRVDHIDGLYDPTTYLQRLRVLAGEDAYITIEKILEPGEQLPAYWPVQGTTGYDFIALVNNLFTMPGSQQQMTAFYDRISGNKTKLEDQLREKKAHILSAHMQGELNQLLRLLTEALKESKRSQATDMALLKEALAAFLVFCPLYRYYSNSFPPDKHEQEQLKKVFARINIANPELKEQTDLLRELLLANDDTTAETTDKRARFFMRCMQFTGPLMAKGVEDTLMYTYNRFLAINEVGDSPTLSANTTEEFHRAIIKRAAAWPATMNATATHDTKRGEDARARLHVLSDMADEWTQAVDHWFEINGRYKVNGAPDKNDEYFIYQALVAAYPMPGDDISDFKDRFLAYIEKALREAKVYTDWANPVMSYEKAAAEFIKQILDDQSDFMMNFSQLHPKLCDAGIVNSLVQLTLKCTCPGIPDLYRGTELWDLSMVDPDNRRPVDFDLRSQWLEQLKDIATADDINQLWHERYSGKIKLWLLHTLLQLRREYSDVFAKGDYIPLKTTGKYAANILAYARCYNEEWIVVILALHTANLANNGDWKDTAVELRGDMPTKMTPLIAGQEAITTNKLIMIQDTLTDMPLSVMHGDGKEKMREAGVLLPVFSLSSPFGIGDFGKGAYDFADFLQSAGQRYWQLLPLNPTDAWSMYSPYSSPSSMACNPLLVSPEMLAEEKLLDTDSLKKYQVSDTGVVNYAHAEQVKHMLLDEAYSNFRNNNYMELRYAYEAFCNKEAYWLDDYALYTALKQKYELKAWFQWPEGYKSRDKDALAEFTALHTEAIDKTRWIQFITARQWDKVKKYCNARNIKLFGDLPFYVSHDSVDVWANPCYFTLDDKGDVHGIAGVPPDYFSEDGQLWGVPTFNWEKLKAENYDWWVKRLKKNTELFDVVRIDHFRALAAYWQVAAGATNARKGEWIKGPGMDFFDTLQRTLGKLPFIAEDLGYEMDEVYALREESSLAGMKVLQFAWGENMSENVDIPHNYPINCVAYTGTHDNNTTLGWYRNETTEADRKRMKAYTGRDVNEQNAHREMAAIVYASVARVAILPMQDILGLDETGRVNTPGTIINNWQWRLPGNALNKDNSEYLQRLIKLYGRG